MDRVLVLLSGTKEARRAFVHECEEDSLGWFDTVYQYDHFMALSTTTAASDAVDLLEQVARELVSHADLFPVGRGGSPVQLNVVAISEGYDEMNTWVLTPGVVRHTLSNLREDLMSQSRTDVPMGHPWYGEKET